MGFRVKITGGKDVEFNEGVITAVNFISAVLGLKTKETN